MEKRIEAPRARQLELPAQLTMRVSLGLDAQAAALLYTSLNVIGRHDAYVRSGGYARARGADAAGYLTEYSLFQHSISVAVLCGSAAVSLGFNPTDSAILVLAACLHDQGKTYDSVFWVNRQFTQAENLLKGHHATVSAQMFHRTARRLRCQKQFWYKPAAALVKQHHTPWKLAPRHLRALGEILHFADIYTACAENRFRNQLPHSDCVRSMHEQSFGGKAEYIASAETIRAVAANALALAQEKTELETTAGVPVGIPLRASAKAPV